MDTRRRLPDFDQGPAATFERPAGAGGPTPPPRQRGPRGGSGAGLPAWLRKPQVVLPGAVILGILAVAFGVQPGGASNDATSADADTGGTATTRQLEIPAASPSPSPSATPSAQASGTTATGTTGTTVAGTQGTQGAQGQGTPTSDVAGARTTAAEPVEEEVDYSRETTQCGTLQETAVPLSVEQKLGGVAVRVQRAAVYPVDYLRCILLATGGKEAVSLAGALGKAATGGATHAVLIDLWITNGGRDFAQLNLKQSTIAAAGQTFAPLATLGGRADVVVSSGQGRNVTLVTTLTNTVGPNTGPITLVIDAPLVGGQVQAGKYQLFLPTP
ncbi:MAG: hypothetical protein IT303_10115 [Dehalococcoidia bacterium]|nr:hypothetical protein [Dehalococcoidia bacterium]